MTRPREKDKCWPCWQSKPSSVWTSRPPTSTVRTSWLQVCSSRTDACRKANVKASPLIWFNYSIRWGQRFPWIWILTKAYPDDRVQPEISSQKCSITTFTSFPRPSTITFRLHWYYKYSNLIIGILNETKIKTYRVWINKHLFITLRYDDIWIVPFTPFFQLS